MKKLYIYNKKKKGTHLNLDSTFLKFDKSFLRYSPHPDTLLGLGKCFKATKVQGIALGTISSILFLKDPVYLDSVWIVLDIFFVLSFLTCYILHVLQDSYTRMSPPRFLWALYCFFNILMYSSLTRILLLLFSTLSFRSFIDSVYNMLDTFDVYIWGSLKNTIVSEPSPNLPGLPFGLPFSLAPGVGLCFAVAITPIAIAVFSYIKKLYCISLPFKLFSYRYRSNSKKRYTIHTENAQHIEQTVSEIEKAGAHSHRSFVHLKEKQEKEAKKEAEKMAQLEKEQQELEQRQEQIAAQRLYDDTTNRLKKVASQWRKHYKEYLDTEKERKKLVDGYFYKEYNTADQKEILFINKLWKEFETRSYENLFENLPDNVKHKKLFSKTLALKACIEKDVNNVFKNYVLFKYGKRNINSVYKLTTAYSIERYISEHPGRIKIPKETLEKHGLTKKTDVPEEWKAQAIKKKRRNF